MRGYHKTEFKNQKSAKFSHIPACYYCVVHASNATIKYAQKYDKDNRSPVGYQLGERTNAYQMAIANEKLKLFKISDFITGSQKLVPIK